MRNDGINIEDNFKFHGLKDKAKGNEMSIKEIALNVIENSLSMPSYKKYSDMFAGFKYAASYKDYLLKCEVVKFLIDTNVKDDEGQTSVEDAFKLVYDPTRHQELYKEDISDWTLASVSYFFSAEVGKILNELKIKKGVKKIIDLSNPVEKEQPNFEENLEQ